VIEVIHAFFSMLETAEGKQRFAEIYEANKCLMLHVAKGILHDNQLAEDVVSEAFIKAMESSKNFEERAPIEIKRYLVTIVRNAAIDVYRKHQRTTHVSFDETFEQDGEHTYEYQESIHEQVEYNDLLGLIDQLPEIYKDALRLTYVMHYSNQEVADLLGLPINAVQVRLVRARQKLRALLAQVVTTEG